MVVILAPTVGECINSPTVIVRGTASDDVTGLFNNGVTVQLNGSEQFVPVVAGGWTAVFTGVGDGARTILASVADNCANTSSAVRVFSVDTTLPVVVILAPTVGECINTSVVVVRGTASDPAPGSGLPAIITVGVSGSNEVILSATIGVGGAWSATFTIPVSGPYTATASLQDLCGNPGSDSVPFNVDVGLPTATVTEPTLNECITVSTVTVSAQCTDDVGVLSCEVTVDGVTWELSPGTFTLTDGPHTAQARAADDCGNTGVSTLVPFFVDTTPPVVTILAPTVGECINSSVVVVMGTASDPFPGSGLPANITVGLTGSSEGTVTATIGVGGSWSATFTILVTGPYTATASLQDLCGNPGSDSVGFSVDIGLPTVVVIEPTPNICFTVSTVTVSATCIDDVGVFSCEVTVDGITWRDSPATFILADGPQTAWARATDVCGNTGVSTLVPFFVDTTPPIVTITIPTAGSTITSSWILVTGTASDPLPSGGQPTLISVTLAGPVTVIPVSTTTTIDPSGNWTATLIGIAPGVYTGVITATTNDGCGNPGIAQIQVLVNIVGMVIAITSPPDGCTPGDLGCPYITCNVTGTSEVYLGGVASLGVAGETIDDGDTAGVTRLFRDISATFLTDGIGRKDRLTITGVGDFLVLGVIDENNLRIITESMPDLLSGLTWETRQPYVLATIPLEATLLTNGMTADPATISVTVTGPTPVGSRVQGTNQFAVTFYGITISSGTTGETVDDGDADGFTNIFTDLNATFVSDGVKQGDQLNVAGQTVIVFGVSDERNLFIETDTIPEPTSGQQWHIHEETTTNAATGMISGYVEIPIPVYLGSDGLAQNVQIVVSLDDTSGGAATDISTVSMQLAHIGVEQEVTVSVDSPTVGVKVCAFVDPICQVPPFSVPTRPVNGLLGYDFMFAYDETVIWFNLAFPDQVYDPTGPFAAFQMGVIIEGDPGIIGYDLRFATDSGSYWYSPANFMILAEIPFRVMGSAGDMSDVDIELFNWASFNFVDRVNANLPSSRQQDGVVIITEPPPPPPPPEITSVCDGAETICDPAGIPGGFGQPMVILGNNFDCAGGVTISFSSPAWMFQLLNSCTATRLDITIATFGGPTDVTVTNNATGLFDTCVGCATSP